jgi:alpha-tubulin suppressor-like RCC1 family protein
MMTHSKATKMAVLLAGVALANVVASAQPVRFVPQPYSESSYALDSEGMLLAWGRNEQGQLGSGNLLNASLPQRLPLPDGVSNWIAAAGGTSCTWALDQDGRLFCCGNNSFKQLGLVQSGIQSNLQSVPFPPGVSRFVDVAGGNGALLLTESGTVYAAGDSAAILPTTPQPYSGGLAQVTLPTLASKVMAGRSFYVVLGVNGQLYLYGYNDAAEIGQGYTSSMSVTNPTLLPLPAGVTRWQQVAPGGFHTWAVGDDHHLYGWGGNNFNQLGVTSPTYFVPSPVQVPFPAGVSSWKQLAAGEYHSAALGDDGQIYLCGLNTGGMLGTGSTTNETRLTRVVRPAGVTNWLAVGAGRYHTLALADDGRVYAWGYGAYGALGNGKFTNWQPEAKPVAYRLNASPAADSATVRLYADVPSGTNWVVETSTNFQNWSAVSTNTVHQAQLETALSTLGAGGFFRLTKIQ